MRNNLGQFVKGVTPHNKIHLGRCKIDGCERTDQKAFGLCNKHYTKLKRRKNLGQDISDLKNRLPRTKEHIENNLSYIKKSGFVSKLRGRTYKEIYGDRYEEHIKKHSESLIGKNIGRTSPMKGKNHTEESKLKNRLAHVGKHSGEKNPMFGKCLELSPAWKGGKSFEPYSPEFNRKLKKIIRDRDLNKCIECGENKKRFHIHHIDYNKKNNLPSNLITLCVVCHTKTNFKREDWINYFKNKLGEKI